MAIEKRYTEFRQTDDGLEGSIVRYGDRANLGSFSEEILPGAIRFDDVIANLQHDRGKPVARTGTPYLQILNTDTSLDMKLTYPDTVYGREARELVEAGVLRGLSIEMRIDNDKFDSATHHRTISDATMLGFGIVDKPAYPASTFRFDGAEVVYPEFIEGVASRRNRFIGGLLQWGQVIVESAANKRALIFEPGSLSMPETVTMTQGPSYDTPLGTTSNGDFEINITDRGVEWEARPRKFVKTAAARDVTQLVRGGLMPKFTIGFQRRQSDTGEVVNIAGTEYSLERVRQGILCELRLQSNANIGADLERRFTVIGGIRYGRKD